MRRTLTIITSVAGVSFAFSACFPAWPSDASANLEGSGAGVGVTSVAGNHAVDGGVPNQDDSGGPNLDGLPTDAAAGNGNATDASDKLDIPKTLPALVPMYMSINLNTHDWLMSRIVGEGAPTYHYTGVQFRILDAPSATPQSRPLYRCLRSGTHFQSNVATCEGSTPDGLLGYVYDDDPKDGAKQILRCASPSGNVDVATLVADDCKNSGLTVMKDPLGWAYPPTS
jgi:hypothetical protein